jgi:hypothetical protein
MNTASGLFIICYVPELYANYKNKNANFYNMPEKALLLLASVFAFSYAILNNDTSLMTNYGPILGLDIIAFLMRLYYVYKNPVLSIRPSSQESTEIDVPSESNSELSV